MNNISRRRLQFEKRALTGILVLLILMLLAYTAAAQKTTVVARLDKHGIDGAILDPANLKAPEDYAYDLREMSITAGKRKEVLAKFDPSCPADERWTVLTVDGKTPSQYEINTFRKGRAQQSPGKAEETSYKIEKETADLLLVSYKLDSASIPEDASFIKDCRVHLTIDLQSKRPVQLQLVNEGPVNIGPLASEKFQITTRFAPGKRSGRYVPFSDDLVMDAKFMGKTLIVEVSTAYSNYRKN